jgi:uncharacterized protein YjbJ (UPF0337 family)
MTDPKNVERTGGGLVGKLVGRVKEAAGSVLDNEELAREGRLQQAAAEAEQEATARAEEAKRREAEAEPKAGRNQAERDPCAASSRPGSASKPRSAIAVRPKKAEQRSRERRRAR